jgi:hypothetical protein
MTKILIGMATAALWFVLSHAANADPICHEGSMQAFASANVVGITSAALTSTRRLPIS